MWLGSNMAGSMIENLSDSVRTFQSQCMLPISSLFNKFDFMHLTPGNLICQVRYVLVVAATPYVANFVTCDSQISQRNN